jgi:2-polyprenyl-3-methyl-5-hydroxy-6-metoxy-1,4-benzoquinol methylase
VWPRLFRRPGAPRQDAFDEILRQFESGTLTLPVSLMELVYLTADSAELEKRIGRAVASGSPRLLELRDFARQHPNAHSIVQQMEAVRTQQEPGMAEGAYWSSEYDRRVGVSPVASVALYSFGDQSLLDAMTDELVGWLEVRDLLKAGARVLDYGCGIGRVMARIAPLVRETVGVDISAAMLREARARLAELGNVRLMHAKELESGATVEPFDLILLIGVLPHIGEPFPLLHDLAGRLAPGGSLIVIDWSSDVSPDAQHVLCDRLARAEGLLQVGSAASAFALSAGGVFHFRRP